MLNWLKTVFQYAPAPRKLQELEAKLSAPDGRRDLYGDIEFDSYEDGGWKLEIEIEHPQEKPEGPLEIRFDGMPVKAFDVARGPDTEVTYRSTHSDLAKRPDARTKVDVYSASGVILSGVFVIDY